MGHPHGRRSQSSGWSGLVSAVVVMLCGLALLFLVLGSGNFPPGSCSSGPDIGGVWGRFFEEESAEPGSGEVKQLLENPNFETSPKAKGDLKSGIVDERLVSALQAIAEEHRICVDAFKEGHYFIRGVPDGPLIPEGYGEAGGLPNTHYYGRAADIRKVDGKPIRGNSDNPDVLDIGENLADIPPQQRPDQIIGPESWAKTLGRSSEEGWILDEDQLERHEDHIHIGFIRNDGTWNAR